MQDLSASRSIGKKNMTTIWTITLCNAPVGVDSFYNNVQGPCLPPHKCGHMDSEPCIQNPKMLPSQGRPHAACNLRQLIEVIQGSSTICGIGRDAHGRLGR